MGIYDNMPVQQNDGLYPGEYVPLDYRSVDTLTYLLWQIVNDMGWDFLETGFVYPTQSIHDMLSKFKDVSKLPLYRYCCDPSHLPIFFFYMPRLDSAIAIDITYKRPYEQRDMSMIFPFVEIQYLPLGYRRAYEYQIFETNGLIIDFFPQNKKLRKETNGIQVPFRVNLTMKNTDMDKYAGESEKFILSLYARFFKAAHTISMNFIKKNEWRKNG